MPRLRVAAFLSGGPIALHALDALAATHQVAVIVRARSSARSDGGAALRPGAAGALGLRPADPVDGVGRRRAGYPIVGVGGGR